MMLGTPFYMSPEQAKAKKVDARTDVWALAVITYECLTGKRPFTGDSFADLVLTLCNAPIPIPSAIAKVPLGFDEWFVHATQRDVDRRFRTARDMSNELIQLANSPLTGRGGDGSAAGPGGYAPMNTPHAGTPGQKPRMSMTTGQSASVGLDRQRPTAPPPAGNGVWYFATAALILLAGGAGLYAYQNTQKTQVAAQAEDEHLELPNTEAPDLPDPVVAPDAPKAKPETSANEPPPPAAPVDALKPKENVRKAETPKAKPPKAKKPAPEPTPEPAAPPAQEEGSSLPPTEWEF